MQAGLTQAFVRDAESQARDIAITDEFLPGFQLRIRASGKKSWLFRYRINGGPQQHLKLGDYPGVTADHARKLALVAAADVARGIDVQLRKREARAETARIRASTLSAFVDHQYKPWARANRPILGTAGQPGKWIGIYEQPRTEWQINRNWFAAVEGVPYQVGDAIQRAGGLNANYVNVELRFGW